MGDAVNDQRPNCQPGCNRVDGHDGRDPGACMRDGANIAPPRPAGWSINRERLAQQDADRDDAPRAPRPLLGEVFAALREALAAEEVPGTVIERVMNRVLYGDPCGPDCVRAVDRDVVVHVHTKAVNAAEIAREVHKLVLQRSRANGNAGTFLR